MFILISLLIWYSFIMLQFTSWSRFLYSRQPRRRWYHLILNISLYFRRSLHGCLKFLTCFHNLRRHISLNLNIPALCKSYASEDWTVFKGTPSVSIHPWGRQKRACSYHRGVSFFYSVFNTFWLSAEPVKLQYVVFSYRKPCWCPWCSYQVCWVLPRSECHGDWQLGSDS